MHEKILHSQFPTTDDYKRPGRLPLSKTSPRGLIIQFNDVCKGPGHTLPFSHDMLLVMTHVPSLSPAHPSPQGGAQCCPRLPQSLAEVDRAIPAARSCPASPWGASPHPREPSTLTVPWHTITQCVPMQLPNKTATSHISQHKQI